MRPTRLTPTNSEKSDLLARARGVLDRIASDVRRAESVAVPNNRSITITMPDDSTRTYAWSGIVGGAIALTVTDGGTTSAVLTDDVQTFTVDNADQPTYSIHHGDAAQGVFLNSCVCRGWFSLRKWRLTCKARGNAETASRA